MGGADPRYALRKLARAFPDSKQASAETQTLYIENLMDVPPALLDRAVAELIRTEEFFPKLATIRRACAELALDLPDEAGALRQIRARMRWAQLDETTRSPDYPEVHPIVREALDHVGGFPALRTSEKPGVVLGQFSRIYGELRAAELRRATLGDDLPALPAGPAAPRQIGSGRADEYPATR